MVSRIDMIEEMMKTSKNDPFLHYAAGLEYKKVGDLEKSISIFEELIKNHPDYLATYYQLGKLYEATNRLEDAIKTYKEGKEVARKENDIKTLSEISEALLILDEDDGECW